MANIILENDENSWFLIANPTAGNKHFSQQWKEIECYLKQYNIAYSYAFTAFLNMKLNWYIQRFKKDIENLFLLVEMEHYIM